MKKWKTFRLNGKLPTAYTLKGTFPGEEAATREMLAFEKGCSVDNIKVAIETGTLEELRAATPKQ